MDDSNSSLGSNSEESVTPDNKTPNKICGVCGDKAKSYHFGGLCCESCKAFFRRAMHNDSYKSFFCVHGQTCSINKENRRSCQFCRIKRCFSIGMEKGLSFKVNIFVVCDLIITCFCRLASNRGRKHENEGSKASQGHCC